MKRCNSIMEEAGAAIVAWFKGLSGTALNAAITKAFNKFDVDGSGFLDRAEFGKAMLAMGLRLSASQVEVLFKEYDVDGTGTIELQEFTQMVRRYLCVSNGESSLSAEQEKAMKQKWDPDQSKWWSAAVGIQRFASTKFAQSRLHQMHAAANRIQNQARGMRDRKCATRLRLASDHEGRFTELNLTVDELLASIPMLCKLAVSARYELSRQVAWRQYQKDDFIVREADPADSMFILIHGGAAVLRGPAEKEIMRFKAGSFFGEQALTQANGRRHASVLATCQTTCIEISREVYQQCLNSIPESISRTASCDADAFARTSSHGIINGAIQKVEDEINAPGVPIPGYMDSTAASTGGPYALQRLPSQGTRRHHEAIRMSQSTLNDLSRSTSTVQTEDVLRTGSAALRRSPRRGLSGQKPYDPRTSLMPGSHHPILPGARQSSWKHYDGYSAHNQSLPLEEMTRSGSAEVQATVSPHARFHDDLYGGQTLDPMLALGRTSSAPTAMRPNRSDDKLQLPRVFDGKANHREFIGIPASPRLQKLYAKSVNPAPSARPATGVVSPKRIGVAPARSIRPATSGRAAPMPSQVPSNSRMHGWLGAGAHPQAQAPRQDGGMWEMANDMMASHLGKGSHTVGHAEGTAGAAKLVDSMQAGFARVSSTGSRSRKTFMVEQVDLRG